MSTDIHWEGSLSSPTCSNDERDPDPKPLSQSCFATITQVPIKYIDKYRQFIRRNRFILRLAEDNLSRLVLYAPHRFVSHSEEEDFQETHWKILPETLYAFINVWSLCNDTIYHGFGNGNGFTVGGLTEDLEIGAVPSRIRDDRSRSDTTITTQTILLLRSILSIVECLAPSLEVSAYSKVYRHGSRMKSSSAAIDQHRARHHRHLNALAVSAKIEKIKFICRMGLLALNYCKHVKSLTKENAINALSSMGILQEGGLLEPNEHVTLTRDETNRVKKLLYVGKRTGRKIAYNNDPTHSNRETSCEENCSALLGTPAAKVGLTAIGELLHVYRPLYYVQSSLRHETIGGDGLQMKMLKSWIISLCFDVLSHKLTTMGKTIHQTGRFNVDISSESTKEELYRRKMRWAMYLLRAPVWNLATYPIAEKISGVVGHVPFVGKPLVQYVMDLLRYWQRWHFMLE